MKIGFIQTGGLGDILIALPIARHYFDNGNEIYWPIKESYLSSFQDVVPWVNWLLVDDKDPKEHYETPLKILNQINVDKRMVLYAFLRSHLDVPNALLASFLKFDQYKYAISNTPFFKKWSLADCLHRKIDREDQLYKQLVKQEKYMVIHRQGPTFHRKFNLDDPKSKGYQIIEIDTLTSNFFDWIKVLENAKGIALVDSVFSNLVDQLGIGKDVPKFFGVRSDVYHSPVLLGNWQYV